MRALNSVLYDATQELQGQMLQTGLALFPPPPATPPVLLQIQRGRAESPGWFLVQAAEFEPEPLSVERLRVRAIWSSERIVSAILDLMVAANWLDRVGTDYYLLPEGQRIKNASAERFARIFNSLQTAIHQTDLSRLEKLFSEIINHSLNCPTPPGNWSLFHSRRRAPTQTDSPLLNIFYYLSDFNAFRDDAHMAAWQPFNLDGYVWETFNHVHSHTANNADQLFTELTHRGYSRQDYVHALKNLVERGWLTLEIGTANFQVTENGNAVHEQVEHLTDEYFYAPWRQIGAPQLEELDTLWGQFDQELKALELNAKQPDPQKL